MDEEVKRRKRGRGSKGGTGPTRPDPVLPEARSEPVDESPQASRSQPEVGAGKHDARRAGQGQPGRSAARPGKTPSDLSPMEFWRSGRARSYRERPSAAVRGPGPLQAVMSLHVPPWMPVVGIIVVVFGILGLLFFTRSALGAPRIGDHWHASYQVTICGEKQQSMPAFEAGGGSPGTHGDGVIHLHPFTGGAEGSANYLRKYFEVGGGKLTGSEIRSPGFSTTWKNGDKCDDGTEGTLQVFLNSEKLDDFGRYIPKDGDRLRIVFGPIEEGDVVETDRTIIAEGQATQTLEMTITGAESDTVLDPSALQVNAEEVVRLDVRNESDISHGLRVAGPDGEYDTADDFVSNPDIIPAGETGFLILRFDSPGTIEFRDSTATEVTGTIVVGEAQDSEPSPGASPAADAEAAIEATEDSFIPEEISAVAGQTLKITVSATGRFAHNIRIAGPDGQYETDDDLVSEDVGPGGRVEFVVTMDEPGSYKFRCDFHTQTGGTLVVE